MLFYLDKELAKQGIAKCIAVSEIEITQEELEARKQCFNIKEVLIFEGMDIPHKFKYNEKLDTIEEVIEIVEDTPQTLSDEIEEIESEFDESVEIEPEVYYFYIDKEIADKFYVAETITTFRKPVLDPDTYFTKPTYMIKGKHTPYYITVEDGIVREATEYEKYTRGQRKLQDREVAFKNEIIYLEEGWYIEGEELIKVPKPEGVKLEFNEETHQWEEKATQNEIDLDTINKMYREYESMDTPSVVKEMQLQDPALAEEFLSMLIELRITANTIQQGMSVISELPHPSCQLVTFKNKYKTYKESDVYVFN